MKILFENSAKLVLVLALVFILSACTPSEDPVDVDEPVATATKEVEEATPTEVEMDEDEEITPTEMDDEDEDMEEDEDMDEEMDGEEKEDGDVSNKVSDRVSESNWANVEGVSVEVQADNILVTAQGTHKDSCSRIEKYEWSRNGNVAEINLTLQPVADDANCSDSTREFNQEINISPSSFKPGEYSADVNGVVAEFEIGE